MSKLIHRRTTVSNICYHIVWSTKRRKRIIVSQMEADFKEWATDTAERHHFTVRKMEAGHKDHVHLFISAPPNTCISDIFRYLKGNLSIRAFRKYSFLSKAYPDRHMWNPSTYIETIGCISEEAVLKYISNQEKDPVTNHRRKENGKVKHEKEK